MAIKQAIPAFARGSEEKLRIALAEGGRFYPPRRIVWCYISEGERIGQLAFCTPALVEGTEDEYEYNIEFIKGDNDAPVQFLDELPSTSDAVEGVLYVVDDKGYHFNGEEFVKIFDEEHVNTLEQAFIEDSENLHNSLDELNSSVNELSETIGGFDERIASVEESVAQYDQAIADINEAFEGINQDIAQNKNDISSLNDSVDAINADITNINNSMSEMQADLTDHESRIVALESGVETINSTLDTHGEQISGISDDIGTINDDIDDIHSQLEMDFYI